MDYSLSDLRNTLVILQVLNSIFNVQKLNFEVKESLVNLAGNCFWFWGRFHSFLDTCEVPRAITNRYPQGVFSKYDAMRNILNDLESDGKDEIIKNIISGFYRLSSPVDKENLDIEKAKEMLKEFRNIVGNDPIEEAIRVKESKRRIQQWRNESEEIKRTIQKLAEIKVKWDELYKGTNLSPQKRGFDLEKLFFEILSLEKFEFHSSYKSNGEQIDGHFKFSNFDYLLEIKWEKGLIKKSDMSIFDGRIRSKAQSTRGLFFAVNGFEPELVSSYSGSGPKIMLMDGMDFIDIVEGRITFFDCISKKIDAMVRHGNIYSR